MRQLYKNEAHAVEVLTDARRKYVLKIGAHIAAIVAGDDTKRVNELADFLKGLEK